MRCASSKLLDKMEFGRLPGRVRFDGTLVYINISDKEKM